MVTVRLRGRRRAFVEEWFKDFNGTRAAERAGYMGNENTLAVTASRMLRNAKVRAYISERFAAKAMDADEVLARLANQARGDIGDLLQPGGIIDLDRVKAAGLTHLIKSITYQKGQRVRVELYSSQRALELIGKHQRLFVGRYEHSGLEGGPIEVTLTEVVVKLPDEGGDE